MLGLTRPITASTGACAACSKLYQAVVRSRLASALSFSHVDVGDSFQFINHISAVCLQPARLKTTGRSGVGVHRRVQKLSAGGR